MYNKACALIAIEFFTLHSLLFALYFSLKNWRTSS